MWGWNRQVWEKSKGTTQSDVRTTQYENVTVKCEKKSKGTTKCEKKIVTYDVGTAQYENEAVKCERKVRESLNVKKELSYVILELYNARMELSSVRKK